MKRAEAAGDPDLDRSVEELLAKRYAAGRRERGLGPEAPFAWDRAVGLDELEELLDAAIYRRERYRLWYGRSSATRPSIARVRMAEALGQIEALRLELRHGPLVAGGIRSQAEPRTSSLGQPGAPTGSEGRA